MPPKPAAAPPQPAPGGKKPTQPPGTAGGLRNAVPRDTPVYILPLRKSPPQLMPLLTESVGKLSLGPRFGMLVHSPTTLYMFRGTKCIPVPYFEGKPILHVSVGSFGALVACVDALYIMMVGGSDESSKRGDGNRFLESRESAVSSISASDFNMTGADITVDPIPFPANARVTQVCVGRNHAVVLMSPNNGHHSSLSIPMPRIVVSPKVFVFGSSGAGALGLGSQCRSVSDLTEVQKFSTFRVMSIHCGPNFTIVVCVEGIYGFGENSSGQLGLGHTHRVFDPESASSGLDVRRIDDVQCGSTTALYLLRDGSLAGSGDLMNGAPPVSVITPVVVPELLRSVSCGSSHSLAITRSGTLLAKGHGGFGELGVGLGVSLDEYKPVPFFTQMCLKDSGVQVFKAVCGVYTSAVLCTDAMYVFGRGIGPIPIKVVTPSLYVPSRPSTVAWTNTRSALGTAGSVDFGNNADMTSQVLSPMS